MIEACSKFTICESQRFDLLIVFILSLRSKKQSVHMRFTKVMLASLKNLSVLSSPKVLSFRFFSGQFKSTTSVNQQPCQFGATVLSARQPTTNILKRKKRNFFRGRTVWEGKQHQENFPFFCPTFLSIDFSFVNNLHLIKNIENL